MMRRLTEDELSREPPSPLGLPDSAAQGAARVAGVLQHVQCVLASELQLSDEQQCALQPLLEHAIARGLWSAP